MFNKIDRQYLDKLIHEDAQAFGRSLEGADPAKPLRLYTDKDTGPQDGVNIGIVTPEKLALIVRFNPSGIILAPSLIAEFRIFKAWDIRVLNRPRSMVAELKALAELKARLA